MVAVGAAAEVFPEADLVAEAFLGAAGAAEAVPAEASVVEDLVLAEVLEERQDQGLSLFRRYLEAEGP